MDQIPHAQFLPKDFAELFLEDPAKLFLDSDLSPNLSLELACPLLTTEFLVSGVFTQYLAKS